MNWFLQMYKIKNTCKLSSTFKSKADIMLSIFTAPPPKRKPKPNFNNKNNSKIYSGIYSI